MMIEDTVVSFVIIFFVILMCSLVVKWKNDEIEALRERNEKLLNENIKLEQESIEYKFKLKEYGEPVSGTPAPASVWTSPDEKFFEELNKVNSGGYDIFADFIEKVGLDVNGSKYDRKNNVISLLSFANEIRCNDELKHKIYVKVLEELCLEVFK